MKIKNMLKIGSLFFISAMLVACYGGKNNKSSPATVLEGTWTYKCATDLASKGNSVQQTQKYTGNQIEQTIISNKGTQCKDPLIETQMTGDFTIGKVVDEHTHIDKIAHKVVVTLRNQTIVDMANAGKLGDFGFGFGLKDWKLNVPKDLTGNKLAFTYYSLNTDAANIFKIVAGDATYSDQLYSGDLNSKVLNNRPINLDMNFWGMRAHK
jgi:hypothetical protein